VRRFPNRKLQAQQPTVTVATKVVSLRWMRTSPASRAITRDTSRKAWPEWNRPLRPLGGNHESSPSIQGRGPEEEIGRRCVFRRGRNMVTAICRSLVSEIHSPAALPGFGETLPRRVPRLAESNTARERCPCRTSRYTQRFQPTRNYSDPERRSGSVAPSGQSDLTPLG
jgi:hypothetical protein